MKYLLALVLIISISAQTPHPVPIPSFSLTTISGLWYVIDSFDLYQTRNFSNEVTCWTLNFTIESQENGGMFDHTIIYNNKTYLDQSHFETRGTNSSWKVEGTVWDWVAFDPVSQSWGTIADAYSQKAILISRSENVSNLVLNAQIAVLKGEGYGVNTTNFIGISQSGCSQSI